MSMPAYSCIESAFTISPPSARARRSASSDFPAAVGPTTAITSCGHDVFSMGQSVRECAQVATRYVTP